MASWGRVVVLGALGSLSACGARNGLDPGETPRDASVVDVGLDAGPRDASRDAPIDAPIDALIDAPIDAVVEPLRCPALGDEDFRVVALATPELGFAPNDVVLAGDGERVVLAVTESLPGQFRSHLYRVDPDDGETREVGVVDGRVGAMDVTDGVARVLAMDGPTLHRIDGDVVTTVGATDFFHSSRFERTRPAWNGTHLVVASSIGFFGALIPGETSPEWRVLAAAGVALAPELGTSNTLLVESTTEVRLQVYDAAGVAEAPAVALTTRPPWGRPVMGALDEDDEAVFALASTHRNEDGTFEVSVERFARDGGLLDEVVLPTDPTPSAIDLSTVPVPPHRAGHGLVVGGDAPSFHGAAGERVGAMVPMPLACRQPTIAAGPCGYVVACGSSEGLALALAIPPR